MAPVITLTGYSNVRAALFNQKLAQAREYTIEEVRPDDKGILENTLLVLHGRDHQMRKRRENVVFRRSSLEDFEGRKVPPVIDHFLRPLVDEGHGDLMDFGMDVFMVIAALMIGIDFDWRDDDARRRLIKYSDIFAQGVTRADSNRDIDDINRDVEEALIAFRREFYDASLQYRVSLGAEGGCPVSGAHSKPQHQDLVSLLVDANDELNMDAATLLRETAFFLESGVLSSSDTMTFALFHLLDPNTPEEIRERARDDIRFTQSCALESLRLHPPSHFLRRRATHDITIGEHEIPAGTVVRLDIDSANTDVEYFGDDAEEFKPERPMPAGVKPAALSFSGGAHTCIGRTVALGAFEESATDDDKPILVGAVSRVVQALLRAGVELDTTQSSGLRTDTKMERWSKFPVVFPALASSVS